mmetsp:Transcript_36309/g.145222  ORF Transcript_36309/g.145222 Transcript_36309/m.145222 type:complete len:83 (+) Transcript_36309:1271-1519(+)
MTADEGLSFDVTTTRVKAELGKLRWSLSAEEISKAVENVSDHTTESKRAVQAALRQEAYEAVRRNFLSFDPLRVDNRTRYLP